MILQLESPSLIDIMYFSYTPYTQTHTIHWITLISPFSSIASCRIGPSKSILNPNSLPISTVFFNSWVEELQSLAEGAFDGPTWVRFRSRDPYYSSMILDDGGGGGGKTRLVRGSKTSSFRLAIRLIPRVLNISDKKVYTKWLKLP